MKKQKSKELEKLGLKIERLTKDFNNKNITNMVYLIKQEKVYKLMKDKYYKELGFQERILLNTALNVCKMGLTLERKKSKQ